MRRSLVAALAMMAVVAALLPQAQAAQTTNGYIVVLKGNADPDSVSAEHSSRFGARVEYRYHSALKGYAGQLTEDAAAQISADSRVAWVERDKPVHITAQSLPTGINRVDADLSPTADIDGVDERVDVDIAIIDTGIDIEHPDLNVLAATQKNCIGGGTSAEDGHGHGSHVAGTAAAIDNGDGVVGMAPGARLWAVRVLNNAGFGTTASVVCGIDYVTAHADEIEVANMSLGGGGSDDNNCGLTNGDAEHQAICASVAAGVVYAVAAGNDADNAANHIPAAYNEVITVSALADFNGVPGGGAPSTCYPEQDDTRADFSNFGPDVDITAPGVCIHSTFRDGGYNNTFSGTSMASPHVAGAAALLLTRAPNLTPAQVRQGLLRLGNLNYTWPDDDPDGIKEKLLNVKRI